jgi:hypothetical protein
MYIFDFIYKLPDILPKKRNMIQINPKMKKLFIPVIAGLFFAGFLIYDQKGTFGISEIIVLVLTCIVVFGFLIIVNKTTKND